MTAKVFNVGDQVQVVQGLSLFATNKVGQQGKITEINLDGIYPIAVELMGDETRSVFDERELELVDNATQETADRKVISESATREESTGKFAGYFGHPDFYTLLDDIALLHSVKNHDYCPGSDPLGNFKSSADLAGIEPWRGILVRMGDKMSRLSSFAKKGQFKVNNESVEDTLKDMATYSLLALLCYREGKDEKNTV